MASGWRRKPVVAIGFSLVILAGALIGAFTFFGGDRGSSGTHIDATAPTRPQTEEQKVVETLNGLFKARYEASAIPDPAYPLLSVYATGPLLKADVDDLTRLKDQGLAAQAPPNSISERRVEVLSLEGDQAQAEVCSIDDGIVVHADTRQPAYEYPPGASTTTQFRAELVREFGAWKVSVLTRQQRWEGVAGCAVGDS